MKRVEPATDKQGAPDPVSILVVEDEVLLRIMIAEAFRNAGFDVIEAGTADEALDVLRSGVGIDVVFTDISMPGSMNGLELAQLVRAKNPSIKIFVASAERLGAAVLFDHFFPKPYDTELIIMKVKSVVERRDP